MLLKRLLFVMLYCVSTSLYSQPNSFGQKYQHLVQQMIPHASVGIIIQDPHSGKVLFEKQSQHYFSPASNTKILTAMAALKSLGPEFRYQTSLHADVNNIYIVFQGDPTFTTADLNDLLSILSKKRIQEIKGNIIIDDSAFEGPAYAPGWTWDSIPWYYSAPITSIILNENKVQFRFAETGALWAPIKVEQDDLAVPPLSLVANVKAVTVEESKTKCRLEASVKNNEVMLLGCWPKEKTPMQVGLALDQPRKLLQDLINLALQKQSIKLSGDILFKKMPDSVPLLVSKQSLPLKTLLSKVLADSNNVYTESLTKTIGRVYYHEGSFQAGVKAIQNILSQEKLDLAQLPLSDGSGQSRYNLITPYILAQLLDQMYHDPLFSHFYQALSVNGKTGSLQNRMKEKEQAGKIVAKTGTVMGISALSGYFTAANNKMYIFSMIINQSDKNDSHLKDFENKICQLMLNESWE